MPQTARKSLSWQLVCILVLTLLLALTINGESLWTDEAFSAFMASHRSLGSLVSTFVGGDSSDLQMFMYYTYLFFWGKLFGLSEVAFRTANIPFGFLFSGALVWAGQRVFNSRVTWIAAALSPLLWSFANDARPYFAITAFSTVCVASLLAYLEGCDSNRKSMPWIVLLSLLIGATFHMLMLLLVAPLCVLLFTFWKTDKSLIRWADWKLPLAALAPLAVVEAAFFAWTFSRGATYEYARPDLLSMASVAFRFAGLSGYYPNRRYDIPFRPYLPAMALASVAFVVALSALWLASKRAAHRRSFRALAFALVAAGLQVVVMSLIIRQQVEARHLASVLPLLLFLIMTGLSRPSGEKWGRSAQLSFSLLVCIWFVSDARLIFLPEYKREDFRDAVLNSLDVSGHTKTDIALVADPAAAAYYGLGVTGPQPCFPLSSTCADGFAKVPWPVVAPADYAAFWNADRVASWMAKHKGGGHPGVVLISRSRHPMYKDCPWWPSLQYAQYSKLYSFHGFYVYIFS